MRANTNGFGPGFSSILNFFFFHSFFYLFAFDVPLKLRFGWVDGEGKVKPNAVGTQWRLLCKRSNARQRDDIETFPIFCAFIFGVAGFNQQNNLVI